MNNTLITGLDVLEFLTRQRTPLGVTEIAQQMGLVKSNAHRILQSLTAKRYVVKHDSDKTYSASLRLWELGCSVVSNLDLRHFAEPAMESLLDRTSETVHLSCLDRHDVVYIHRLESTNPVRAFTEIGGRSPAHCVATGKVLLANLPPAALARVAQSLSSDPAAGAKPVESGAFLEEMRRVLRRGYAINRGEWREGVSGVAAAILDGTGAAVAAIGVSGPSERFTAERIEFFASCCTAAAGDISRKLAGGA